MPYPLHQSVLTMMKSSGHTILDSDEEDADVLLGDEDRPPPVPRKDSPTDDQASRSTGKLVKADKRRDGTSASSSMSDASTCRNSSTTSNFFSRFACRQPVQLPRLDTSVANATTITKKPSLSGLSTRTQRNKTRFKEEFGSPCGPPSESISHNPSPQTHECLSPRTYIYKGQQMDVHGAGHYKHNPLVKNNSADVLFHGGWRPGMEHKDTVPIMALEEEVEEEKVIRHSARRLSSHGSRVAERPRLKSIVGRMDSGTLIVDELDKVLAQQDQADATAGNDDSADVRLDKSRLDGLTMPRRRLPRSDTYYDLTSPPPLPSGLIRSGSLPILSIPPRPAKPSASSGRSFFDRTYAEYLAASPSIENQSLPAPIDGTISDRESPSTPTKAHPEPLYSNPPNQPPPVFSPSSARPRSAEIIFNTHIFTLSSSLAPMHPSGAQTPPHHSHGRPLVLAPLSLLSVDYPFYNPTKPPHAQFTSTHMFNSRGSASWGDAKRWRCCSCGGLTIVEQSVCANLRCVHERCHIPECREVAIL